MENASLSALTRCKVPNETIAKRLKFSTDFIIDQKRVQIDVASKFDNGAFAKVIRASYVGAEVRVKRFHAILCSSGEGAVRLDLHRFFQECRLAQTLRHPNIVHFYGVVMDGNQPMLVMETLVCTLYDFVQEPLNYAPAAEDVFEPLEVSQSSGLVNDTVTENSTIGAAESSSKGEVSPAEAVALITPSVSDHSELSEEAVKSKPAIQNRLIKHVHKATIALNVAQGLEYLHTKKPYPIVHRDLSSRNILLGTISNRFVAKIGDFGQCKEIKHENDWSSANPGTLQYLPPEVLILDSGQKPTVAERKALTITNQIPQGATEIKEQNLDEIPEPQEPDDIRMISDVHVQGSSRPLLRTSLDMYMYGVLIVELDSQEAPHKWRRPSDSPEKSWLDTHTVKMESLNKESIFYQVAQKCLLAPPDKRLRAGEVEKMIKSTFPASPWKGSFNEVSAVKCIIYIYKQGARFAHPLLYPNRLSSITIVYVHHEL